jgi:hypothetical protein
MAESRGSTAGCAEWSITVTRAGGVAGLRRTWSVTSEDDDRVDWAVLVESCPWRSSAAPPAARDLFVWTIAARDPRRERKAVVADPALTGPWRELVDQVKVTYRRRHDAS